MNVLFVEINLKKFEIGPMVIIFYSFFQKIPFYMLGLIILLVTKES